MTLHISVSADSEYVSNVGVERKGAEFVGNKQTNLLTRSLSHKRT